MQVWDLYQLLLPHATSLRDDGVWEAAMGQDQLIYEQLNKKD